MGIPGPLRSASAAIALGKSATLLASTPAADTPEVSKSTVQTLAAKILAAKTGRMRPKVTCPSGVAAKVGAVVHCTVVPHGVTLK